MKTISLVSWQIDHRIGGSVDELSAGATGTVACLRPTESYVEGKGTVWRGCLTAKNAFEVLPGRKYRFTVELRGAGEFRIGVLEHPWKYSLQVLAEPGVSGAAGVEWQKVSFDYTPTGDAVMYARPFIMLSGWHRLLQLQSAEFVQLEAEGQVSASASHYIVPLGGTMKLEIASSAYPVKALLYGTSGVSGLNLPEGGAIAFCDLYKKTFEIKGEPGKKVEFLLPVEKDWPEGMYRAVVVAPSGASAEAMFLARPKEAVERELELLKSINLPDNSRLVFIGDSLTAPSQHARCYVSLIELAFRWRFGDKVQVINAGVGGDNINAIEKRLEKDVLSKKPTHIFIFEGANDCKGPWDYKTKSVSRWAVPQAEYDETFARVLNKLKDTGASVAVATCAPGEQECFAYFDVTRNPFNEPGNRFCTQEAVAALLGIQKKRAAELNLPVIDSNALLSEAMRAREKSGGKQYLHVDDGVHMSEYGARELAGIFMRYLAEKGAK